MEVKPGYKQTEVGVIPEDWRPSTIGAEADLLTGFPFPSDGFVPSGARLLRGSNVKRGELDWQDDITEHWPSITRDIQRYALQDGDVVIAMDGALVGRSYGVVAQRDLPALLVQRVARIRSKTTDLRLLGAWIGSESFVRHVDSVKTHTAIPHISPRDIREFALPLPTDGREQRAIAAALSDVDALLGGLERLIAKKRDLKQAAMQQLLTGQTRLPGFSGAWEDTQVQDVIAGFFCGPSPTCEERNIQDESEWGVLKTTAATKDNGWDWTKHKTLPRVYWNKPHIELKKGDVIVTKAGPRHRVGVTAWVDYVPPRIIPSGKMIALRPSPDVVTPLILAAAISARGAQTYLDQRTTGMAESQVNFENIALLEAPITIPRFEEQTAIAAVLSDIDAELAALEARRDKTRDLKQAMMQELLTGKTRLVKPEAAHA